MAQSVLKLYNKLAKTCSSLLFFGLVIIIMLVPCIPCCTQQIFRRSVTASDLYQRLPVVVKVLDYSSSVVLRLSWSSLYHHLDTSTTRGPRLDSLGLKTTALDTYRILYQLSHKVLGMSSPLFSNYILSSIFWVMVVFSTGRSSSGSD